MASDWRQFEAFFILVYRFSGLPPLVSRMERGSGQVPDPRDATSASNHQPDSGMRMPMMMMMVAVMHDVAAWLIREAGAGEQKKDCGKYQ